MKSFPASVALALPTLALSACATVGPRLHSQNELALVARGCGIAMGELVQEAELKKVLIMYSQKPTLAQFHCVHEWARKNRLHLAYVQVNRVSE